MGSLLEPCAPVQIWGKALDRLNPAEKKTVTLTYSILRKFARTKKLSLIVHTRRDRRYLSR